MKFDHVTLLTENISSLNSFYRRIPGASVNPVSSDGYFEVYIGDSVFGVFDANRLCDFVGITKNTPIGGSVMLQVNTNDINKCYSELLDAGFNTITEVKKMPWGSFSVYLKDPDQNLVEFYQW